VASRRDDGGQSTRYRGFYVEKYQVPPQPSLDVSIHVTTSSLIYVQAQRLREADGEGQESESSERRKMTGSEGIHNNNALKKHDGARRGSRIIRG
jgi:hypothetical protein